MTPRRAATIVAVVAACALTAACPSTGRGSVTATPIITRPAPPTATERGPSQIGVPGSRTYPLHTDIVSTTFWVGEIFNANLSDGSQICSTYDAQWARHWSGTSLGTVPADDPGCPGSFWGGCDGVSSGTTFGTFTCATESRNSVNGYFPTHVTPVENPFYLDLPFDDVNDPVAFAERCQVIPWAGDVGFSGSCANTNFSYLKDHWVQLTGPNGNTCYGQIEDAGPSHDDLYHDAAYVFGTSDARPIQGQFNDAGLDVSPALNGCLGFAELNGDADHVTWRFIDSPNVPSGPWTRLETTSGVTP